MYKLQTPLARPAQSLFDRATLFPGPDTRGNMFRAINILPCLILSLAQSLPAGELNSLETAVQSIQVKELRRHVSVLASDMFEGREAGTQSGWASGAYIRKALKKLELAPAGDEQQFFQEFGRYYRNILAVLPGSDSKLKSEFVVVCAHYDHVGYGTRRNSRGPVGYIHNGADDNASGVAAVLELAEAFTKLDPPPKRSILFAMWDAEEKGLLGSKHWVSEPTIPLRAVRLVINVDMVGRLRDQRLLVYGIRSAPGLRRLISEQNRDRKLVASFTWEMKGESDHYPFFQKNIPAMMLHTGKHDEYHRPDDDIHTLNFDGLQQVARFYFNVAYDAAQRNSLPKFRAKSRNETKELQQQRLLPLANPTPRFGIQWDPKLAEQRIVKLTIVTPNSAADKSGLKVGDRIVKFANESVVDYKDFRTLVHPARNPVSMSVEREGHNTPLDLTLQLDGRPSRIGVACQSDDAEPGCVVIRRILPGSWADLAGLKINDRIYSILAKPVDSIGAFQNLISSSASKLPMVIERNGQIREVTVEVVLNTTLSED